MMSSDRLKILIEAALSKESEANIKKQLREINKNVGKINLGIDIESLNKAINNMLNMTERKVSETTRKISQVTANQFKNAIKGDLYKNVREQNKQIIRDIEATGGQLSNYLIEENKATGEITKATYKYASALGEVQKKTFELEKIWGKDAAGRRKLYANLVETKNTTGDNIDKKRNENYKNSLKLLQEQEQLNIKLLKLSNQDTETAKLYNNRLKEIDKTYTSIFNKKIKLKNLDDQDSLDIAQKNKLAAKQLETQRKIEQIKAQQMDLSNRGVPSLAKSDFGTPVNSPINFNASTEELAQFAKQVYGTKAKITGLRATSDKLGNRLRRLNVQVVEGEGYFKKYALTLDETTKKAYSAERGLGKLSIWQSGITTQAKHLLSMQMLWGTTFGMFQPAFPNLL